MENINTCPNVVKFIKCDTCSLWLNPIKYENGKSVCIVCEKIKPKKVKAVKLMKACDVCSNHCLGGGMMKPLRNFDDGETTCRRCLYRAFKSVKHVCCCGGSYAIFSKLKHENTGKHMEYIYNKIQKLIF